MVRLIADDKQPNLFTYNEDLRRMNRPTWRNVSWLYSECYLYRYQCRSCVANFPDFSTPCSHRRFTGNGTTPSSARRTMLSNHPKPAFLSLPNGSGSSPTVAKHIPERKTRPNRNYFLFVTQKLFSDSC